MSKHRSAHCVIFLITTSALLFGCLGLPTESSVARKYEAEHPGVRVLSVIKTSENEANVVNARVHFHIAYETADSRVMQDTWTHGRVAEGWMRAVKN